ncbi:AbiH family protein [Enterococcus hirae]|uniref:AbiH family protein n=1 Tax=Enterococcus hirae TaxID=1354 RepID=UPI001E345933|nr:AbiH family protein [Enterococcus hirae]
MKLLVLDTRLMISTRVLNNRNRVFLLGSEKLIILGNGFDLASGLRSSYYDFFSKRIDDELIRYFDEAYDYFNKNMYGKDVNFNVLFNFDFLGNDTGHAAGKVIKIQNISHSDNSEHKIYEKIYKSDLTFWDLAFYFSKNQFGSEEIKDYDWQDVERKMLEFLTGSKKDKNVPHLPGMESYVKRCFDIKNSATFLCLHLAYYLPDRKEYSSNEIIEYLYDELQLFEKKFAEYIKTESNKNDYKEKAKEKICKISQKSIENFKDKIFSFNYTDPFSENGLDIINVHGKAETNSILFGIDQETISPDSYIYSFTKTFRQMTETKLAKSYAVDILPNKDDISEIAFFGHSLSNLDYSYFQTIFDHYDIYNSHVKLVFYYEKYKNKTTRDIELDLANKISQMLYAYSPSIDNKKKGRNLLHKLLLEKRLIIDEIN